MHSARLTITAAACLLAAGAAAAGPTDAEISALVDKHAAAAVADRRDFYLNAELSNRETRTGERVAAALRKLGIEVQTGIAHTGVVGILEGGKPGRIDRAQIERCARIGHVEAFVAKPLSIEGLVRGI